MRNEQPSQSPRQETPPDRFSILAALGIFSVCFGILAWPWLSGEVTIPWDAKAQFMPQLQFLARSFAAGESPFWTPNVFAGWPQIADPQSLIFSPLHLLLAWFNPSPSFRSADAVTFALLFIGGLGIILIFRDRCWHIAGAVVAAIAFVFGCSNAARLQHLAQIESLAYLPIALWLLSRALDRSSWRWGIGAGVAIALIGIGRDDVALLALYVLTGFVLWHWLDGDGRWERFRASIKPLAATGIVVVLLLALPLLLTVLLAEESNRPNISYEFAGRGSLHPAHLLMLFFADLYGASDPHVNFWGPPSFPWRNALGKTGLFLAQNMGQIYAGALVAVTIVSFGILRGAAWAREIRFFTIAAILMLLFALGWYTPAFRVMFEVLPGVSLFRRPAGATFVFGAMIAVMCGYLVHRWLTNNMPSPRPYQRAIEAAIATAVVATATALAFIIGTQRAALVPILTGIVFFAGAIAALFLARRFAIRPFVATVILAGFVTADLAWNNAPSESTGLPPATYEALRPNTDSETVVLLKSRLAATAAPDRRDRVEMIGIAYHWPNLGLTHGFDHLFGQNPLRLTDFEQSTSVGDTVATPDQRTFSPLFPSYRSTMADLFGIRFIATGVPVEQIDTSLKPGDLRFIRRTRSAYVYENPRALPRVMIVKEWRVEDFDYLIESGMMPEFDPRRSVLLEDEPEGVASNMSGGTAKILSYRNTEIIVETLTQSGGILVLNDVWHSWWRATVDDKPAEILRANVLFRAVPVGPGKHIVRFEFHPIAGAIAEAAEKFTEQ
ncbi:MAG TPA: hypothetical protein VM867_11420 [Xanthobacteraceae bacterium]|nr:hypothetical protein [Xanthobacteraceae bacterium]